MHPVVDNALRAALHAANPIDRTRRAAASLHISGDWSCLSLGKAAATMAKGALEGIGRAPARSLIVLPDDIDQQHLVAEVLRSDHPIPTSRSINAGRRVVEFVNSAAERGATDHLVVCLSGGASALACFAKNESIIAPATRAMLQRGACIHELNSLRRAIEPFKGGGLARLIAGRVATHVLVLSDVIGDDLCTIASGPFAACGDSVEAALEIVDRLNLEAAAPGVRALIENQAAENRRRARAAGPDIPHTVIACNADVVASVVKALRDQAFHVEHRTGVEGDTMRASQHFAQALLKAAKSSGGPRGLVWGGETIVTLEHGAGFGGRNQAAALRAAIELDGAEGLEAAFFATDGVDGLRPPGEGHEVHGGARVNGQTAAHARECGVDLLRALSEGESYRATQALGIAIKTGPTGTNVNDLWIGIAESPRFSA